MKRILVAVVIALLLASSVFGQRESMTLTFTAVNNTAWVQLDSIKIMNRTQGGDTVLLFPDTVLVLDYTVGIPEEEESPDQFQVLQCYPNPTSGYTTITMHVPQKDRVRILVTDVLGRIVLKSERTLDKGTHSFRFTPGEGNLFYLSFEWRGCRKAIKAAKIAGAPYGSSAIEYLGCVQPSFQLKTVQEALSLPFTLGDNLLFIGYTEGLESGMLDAPDIDTIYHFQFATNIPCPGMPTVEYGGQVYNTIQIFGQCWLKENLNVGEMIPGTMEQVDNGTIEKYCYDNDIDSCTKYGGLYQWNEMMQYTAQQSARGICPPGWHLPADEEWKVLEGAVDSQYGIGNAEWDLFEESRGYDAGTNLKTTSGWFANHNGTDLFGFSGLPGGSRYGNGYFAGILYNGLWWASTDFDDTYAWYRHLIPGLEITRNYLVQVGGFSVRCLKDD
jgi:uncharacterized protein (TIGR02145 family)